MKLGSSGGARQACRRRRVEVWSSGAREARYRCVDMEVERYKTPEVRCGRADVGA